MEKVHLDTDLGGDMDDLCALALLLRWPGGVELTGITTVAEVDGRRAGYVRYVLNRDGRGAVPVAAGAEVSQGYYRYSEMGLLNEERYWPEPIAPAPGPFEQAVALLKESIEQGALIIAIGPYTNLALLERQHPGILGDARLVLMGGSIFPIRPGYPNWTNEMDFNIQADVPSARCVLEHSNPTIVPMTMTVETALRRAYLDDLRSAGWLGELLARQAEEFAIDEQNDVRLGQIYPNLPDDLINFQHDPLACAIALGWQDGVKIQELPLVYSEQDSWLVERVQTGGRPARVVTRIDGPRFNEFWLDVITGRS